MYEKENKFYDEARCCGNSIHILVPVHWQLFGSAVDCGLGQAVHSSTGYPRHPVKIFKQYFTHFVYLASNPLHHHHNHAKSEFPKWCVSSCSLTVAHIDHRDPHSQNEHMF